jgi:hypothetical protein
MEVSNASQTDLLNPGRRAPFWLGDGMGFSAGLGAVPRSNICSPVANRTSKCKDVWNFLSHQWILNSVNELLQYERKQQLIRMQLIVYPFICNAT